MRDRVSRALSYTSKLRDTWDDNWKLWYSYVDTTDSSAWPMRSKVFVPITHAVVDTYVSAVVAGLAGGDEYFSFQPKTPEAVDNARLTQRYVNYSLRTDVPYFDILHEHLQICGIFGTAILKCRWRREYAMRTFYRRGVFARMLNLDRYHQQTVKVRIKDCPELTIARLYDTFVEPHATRMEDTPWVIERNIESYLSITRRAEASQDLKWQNLDELKKAPPTTRSGYTDTAESRHENAEAEYDSEGPGRKYETLTMWDKETGRVVYAVCSAASPDSRSQPSPKFVLYDSENPYENGELPFVASTCLRVPGSFYGIGWPQLVKGLQAIINTQTNQRVDCVTRSMMAPTVCDIEDYNDYSSQWVRQPDALWPAEKPEALRSLQMARIPAEAFTEQDVAFNMLQWVTAIASSLQGMSSGTSETATGIKLLLQSGSTRMAAHVSRINDTSITRLGTLFLGMYAQFTDKPVFAPNAEGKLIQLLPEQIAGNQDVNIVPTGSAEELDRNGQVARIVQVMGAISQTPGAQGVVNWREVVKELLAKADLKDTTKFVLPEPKPTVPPQVTAMQVQAEHQMLVETGQISAPASGQDHKEHMLLHSVYGYGPDYQELADEAQWALLDHITATSKLMMAEEAAQQDLPGQTGQQGQPMGTPGPQPGPPQQEPPPEIAEQNATKSEAQLTSAAIAANPE